MRRMLRLPVAGVAGLAVLFAVAQVAGAISGNQANVTPGKCWEGSKGCYHWARAGTGLTLTVENDLTAGWAPYFASAIGDWTGAWTAPLTNESVSFALNGENLYRTSSSCAGISGEVRVCNRKYGYNGWLGLASIWVSSDGEHITAGTVKLNDSYFSSSTYNTPEWRSLVTCQELAHTLGLNHEDENFYNENLGSCMDYTADPDGGGAYGPSNLQPSAADYATLANMYSDGDSTTTVKSAASGTTGRGNGAGNGADIEDALPPGAGPRDGDVFERQLPDGSKIVTHVFWADRGKP